MKTRTIFFSLFLLLALAGLIATATGRHWWKEPVKAEAGETRPLPPIATEYARLMARYRGADSAMNVAGSIRIYDGEKNDLRETRTFHCFREKAQYYWQCSYMQTYCDGRYVLQVDTVHRMLTVSKPAARGSMPLALLFSDTATFRMRGEVKANGGQRELVLYNDYQPDIRRCRIFYDTADYRLHRAEIEWWKGATRRRGDTDTAGIWLGKVDYDYRPWRRPDIAAAMAVYVTIRDGQVMPTAAYKDYQLNTNL